MNQTLVQRLLTLGVIVPFVIGFASASAAPPARVAFTFTDPAIVESSALVSADGLFVTANDSGDTGRIFTVDPDTGDTVGVTTWPREPVDVEALAPAGGGEVWVGDIGDNGAARSAVTVARLPFGRGDRSGPVPTYDLVYPGGAQDAETLMVDPQTRRLVIVTKGIFGGDVLVAPATLDSDRPNRMRLVGTAIGVATDGSFFPDGRHFIVRSYGRAAVYTWPGLAEVDRWELPDQDQGEGVAVRADRTVFLSSEGALAPVLRIRLPAEVRRAVRPVAPPEPPEQTAEPRPAPQADEEGLAGQERPVWPWLVGGVVGVAMLGVLVRSLRPRG